MLVPVANDHAALAWGPGYTIHASKDSPMAVALTVQSQPAVRTACGSDVYPYLVGIVDHPGQTLLMTWPPPPGDRCPDCVRILGRVGKVSDNWFTLE